MIPIYARYFYKELLKVFFLFLGCFFFLYVLIDYASHLKSLHQQGLHFWHVILYYFFQFSSQAEILVPAAFLVALVKVLLQLCSRNELVALLASGLSLRRIVIPFFISSLLCAFVLYANFQWIAPYSNKYLCGFKSQFLKGDEGALSEIGHLRASDGSLLIFGSYDPSAQVFHDAYWILNSDELYRIKTLYPHEKPARGLFVDHLVREKNGELKKKMSFETREWPSMKFELKALQEAVSSTEWHSITSLLPHFSFSLKKVTDQVAAAKTILLHKLTIPLLSLLVCLGALPVCLQFRRISHPIMIYSLSFFALIAFFMLISALKILGTSQVVPPLLAILLPYLISFTFLGYRYATL